MHAAADKGLRGWEAMDQGGSRTQHTLRSEAQVGCGVRPRKSQQRSIESQLVASLRPKLGAQYDSVAQMRALTHNEQQKGCRL